MALCTMPERLGPGPVVVVAGAGGCEVEVGLDHFLCVDTDTNTN